MRSNARRGLCRVSVDGSSGMCAGVIVGAVAMGAVVLGTASVGAAVVTTPIVVAVMGTDTSGEMVEAPEPGGCGTDDCSQDHADRAAAPSDPGCPQRARRLEVAAFGSYPAAMTEMRSSGTVGDLLASGRRRRFVGRASKIEFVRAVLESAEPPCSRLHLWGPGAMGKTRLLDGLAGPAADTAATGPDDLGGKGRRADGIDLLGTLARF
jgi:hypothetical protein